MMPPGYCCIDSGFHCHQNCYLEPKCVNVPLSVENLKNKKKESWVSKEIYNTTYQQLTPSALKAIRCKALSWGILSFHKTCILDPGCDELAGIPQTFKEKCNRFWIKKKHRNYKNHFLPFDKTIMWSKWPRPHCGDPAPPPGFEWWTPLKSILEKNISHNKRTRTT